MPPAPTLAFERSLLGDGQLRLACVDEVGRGALAGPVSVGIVVIDAHTPDPPDGIKDSKLLSAGRREALVPVITDWSIGHAVGHASNTEIDALGIIAALRLAGHRALDALTGEPPDLVLLDGSHDWLSAPPPDLLSAASVRSTPPVRMRVKADLDCAGVAAASVLAKVARDHLMVQAAAQAPAYGWERNKGYAAGDHLAALRDLGPSPWHRISWRLPGSSTGNADPGSHPQAGSPG